MPSKRKFLSPLSELALEDRNSPTDFTNSAPIAVPSVGTASPYPSTITVSGLTGQQITGLRVTLNNLSHTAPDNLDIMLISPTGVHIYLMSDAGGGSDQPASGVTLTFADTGPALSTGQLTTGTFRPTNIDQGDSDDIPGAPATPAVTSLAAFIGSDPNGTWELRVNDDTAFDGGSIAGGYTLSIDSRANTAPVAVADSYTVSEDGMLIATTGSSPFGVLKNDTDAENDPLTAQLVSGPAHGTLALNADGSFTYLPRPDFNGADSFTYRASDGASASAVTAATITVTAVNDVPVATNDAFTVQNGGPQTLHRAAILGNDLDPDLTYRSTIFSNNFEGLATNPFNAGTNGGPGADGTDWGEIPAGFTRDNTTSPAPASSTAAGAEFFGWHALDIDSWASQQGDQARSQFARGGAGKHGTVLVADGDAYADFVPIDPNLYTTLLTTPAIPLDGVNRDSLSLEFDSSFRPEDPGTQFARVSVSYDGGPFNQLSEFNTDNTPGGAGSQARINDHLTYNLPNPAGAKSVQFRWGYEQAGNDWWWALDNIAVSGAKTDPAQETIQIQSQPAQGSVAVDAKGAVVYTPPSPTFTGATSFTYNLFDGSATSNTATVSLTVNGNAAAPVANPDSFTTVQGSPVSVQFDRSLLANDTDPDTGGSAGLRAVLVTAPTAAQGTVALNPDGTFAFTPNPAFFGTATFTYKANDGSRDSAPATVTITVAQNNFAAPVAGNDSYTVSNNGSLAVPAAAGLLANDTDADGNPLVARPTVGPNGLVVGPDHGTLAVAPDGSFTYTPRPFFNGTDRFTYQAFDGAFLSSLATVTITVAATNVAPVANSDTYSARTGVPLTVPARGVLANDRDDGPNTTLFSEGFEGLTLLPYNTGVPGGDGTDYTDALPAGWVRDNTTTPAPASPTTKGAEFFGWHAMDVDSWVAEQGNQARSDFTRGGAGLHGTVLVADGDAYDDFVSIGGGKMSTLLVTPSIPLGSIQPNSLELEFDSSFRPEDPPPANQFGRVEVSYDGGGNWATLTELTPANSGGPGSRSRTNEHLTLSANNPAGATSAQFRISYLEAGNDWWWAIDNVKAVGSTANPGAALTAQLVTAPPASQGTVALNADGSFAFTPAAGFTGVASFTYKANDGANDSAPVAVNVFVGPQAVVQVNAGDAQRSTVRSITVPFGGVATFAGSPASAFTLTDAAGAAVPFTVALSTVNGATVATLTFAGPSVIGGSLADGTYTLKVLANQVTIAGQPLDGDGDGTPGGDLVSVFTRKFGDQDGDGDVDGIDLARFRQSLGSAAGGAAYRDYFDFDNDGDVDGIDLARFRQRFNT